MKRISALILSVLLLVSACLFSFCDASAYGKFSSALEKFEKLDSFDATMVMKTTVEVSGTTVSTPVTYNIKASGLKSEKPVFSADMSVSVLGFNTNVGIYSDSEYYYISSDTGNAKMKASNAMTADYDVVGDVDQIVAELPEDLFSEVKFEKNDDGTQTVHLTMTPERFAECFGDLGKQLAQSAAEGTEFGNLTFDDIKVAVTVNKDGYISEYDLSFAMNMTMTVLGTSITTKASCECSTVFNNPGAAVTVTAPEGIESYTEIG